MDSVQKFDLGDVVRIANNETTQKLNLVGKTRTVFGCTVPDSSGVTEIIGKVEPQGIVVNVFFDDLDEGFWFAEWLVELVEVGVGTKITIEGHELIRDASGEWIDQNKKQTSIFDLFKNIFPWIR